MQCRGCDEVKQEQLLTTFSVVVFCQLHGKNIVKKSDTN